MGINQELLTRLLLGATVGAEVPAAHTHKGRDKCKEPEPKAAVHRSNGPQEACTGQTSAPSQRQQSSLGKQTTEEEGPANTCKKCCTQYRTCWWAKSKFPLSLDLPRLGSKWIGSAVRKSTSPHMHSPLSYSIQCIANISRHLGWVGQEDGDRFCMVCIAALAYRRGRHHFYQAMCEKWDLTCYVFLKASQNSFSPWGQFQLHSLCSPIISLILTFTLFPSTF